jgi:hypothetical protein
VPFTAHCKRWLLQLSPRPMEVGTDSA